MRDNETGAAVSGVYPAQYKILAFATSAFVTSIGGGCFALAVTTIGPNTLRPAALDRVHRRPRHRRCGDDPRSGDRRRARGMAPRTGRSRSTGPGPPRPPSRVPRRAILYGTLLVLIIFFMPGGIVYGLRLVRSKFMLIVPLPADAQWSDHDRGRRSRSRRRVGRGAGGDVDAEITFGPGVCPNIHTGPPTRRGKQPMISRAHPASSTLLPPRSPACRSWPCPAATTTTTIRRPRPPAGQPPPPA